MQVIGFAEPVPGQQQILNEFSSRIHQHLLEIKRRGKMSSITLLVLHPVRLGTCQRVTKAGISFR